MKSETTGKCFFIGGLLGYAALHPFVMITAHFMSGSKPDHAFFDVIVSQVLMSFSFQMLPWSLVFALLAALTGGFYGKIRQVEAALREGEEKFRNIAASAQDAIIMMDSKGNISYWNEAAERIFGYEKREVVGRELQGLLVPEKYNEVYQREFGSFKVTGQATAIGKTLELSALRKDGTEFPAGISLSAVQFKGEWHAVGIIRDISERKQLEKELWRLSYIDGLTGVANRRHFEKTLDQEWNRATREGKQLSLVMCDIDFFKAYNDTCGHQSGDDCLKKVAKALSGILKRPGDLVARYGGEEFVIILPGADAKSAVFVIEELRGGVEALEIAHPNSPVCSCVTVSLGVASIIPVRKSSPAELIAAADQALYEAKKEGRNQVKICDLVQS